MDWVWTAIRRRVGLHVISMVRSSTSTLNRRSKNHTQRSAAVDAPVTSILRRRTHKHAVCERRTLHATPHPQVQGLNRLSVLQRAAWRAVLSVSV